MPKLGVGIVGLGEWGKKYLYTFSRLNSTRIFVSDIKPSISNEISGYSFATFTEMLKNPQVNAIVITTPENTHCNLTIQALMNHKDVLVEKPMALTLADAEMMYQLSIKNKLVLAVAHMPLYNKNFQKLKRLVLTNAIGKIQKVEIIRTSRGRKKTKTTVLWDLLPHDIALLISIWGEPTEIRCEDFSNDSITYRLSFCGGVTCTGKVAWTAPPFQREIKIQGSRGTSVFQEPIGFVEQHFENLPLTRLCQEFITCCKRRFSPRSNALLGVQVIKCLIKLNEQLSTPNIKTSAVSCL